MKYLLFKAAVIICLALALLVWFNTAYSKAEETAAEEAAKIIYLKGQVKIQHPGDDFWILAKRGMIVGDKDKIKTFVGSEVEIALDSTLKNIIKVEPNTEIILEELKGRRLYMPKGKLLSLIEALPPNSSFEIKTPTAIAGVRGCGISVDTDGQKTNVKCFEDKVYVWGIDVDRAPMAEVVIIDEGYKRIIGRFEIPGELIVLTAFEREQWSRFREKLKEHLDWLREERAKGSRGAALEMRYIERMRELFEETEEGVEDIFDQQEFEGDRTIESPYPSSE